MSRSTQFHREAARGRVARCAILTVSDGRTFDTDTGGALIVEELEKAGHDPVARALVKDEPAAIEEQLRIWIGEKGIEVIVTTGGTGISRRDTTIEVVERLLDKELPGFGELFRMLSWEEIGSAAMLSRAIAGLAGETLVFSLPGSPAAVCLGVRKLIIPELPHLVWERGR